MPEITTRLGPLRLTWDIEFTTDGANVIEVFANLIGISDDAFWPASDRSPQWSQYGRGEHWPMLWDWIEEEHGDAVAASDAAREAIERERNDLRREDAERYAQ